MVDPELGSPLFISHEVEQVIYKGNNWITPGIGDENDHHGYLTTYPSHGMILQVSQEVQSPTKRLAHW